MQIESFIDGIKIFESLDLTSQFVLSKNESDGNFHLVEFSTKDFVLKIENYHRELYPTLYKKGNLNFEINLFNLLEYLNRNEQDRPKSNYFKNEEDVNECFRKQFLYISQIVSNYFELVCDFFKNSKFETNAKSFETYWKKKHPEFYNL